MRLGLVKNIGPFNQMVTSGCSSINWFALPSHGPRVMLPCVKYPRSKWRHAKQSIILLLTALRDGASTLASWTQNCFKIYFTLKQACFIKVFNAICKRIARVAAAATTKLDHLKKKTSTERDWIYIDMPAVPRYSEIVCGMIHLVCEALPPLSLG